MSNKLIINLSNSETVIYATSMADTQRLKAKYRYSHYLEQR